MRGVFALFFSIVLFVAFSCSSSSESKQSCTTSDECGAGKICYENYCVEGCEQLGDCEEGFTCVDTNSDGIKECVEIECKNDDDCEQKYPGEERVCNLGACVKKVVKDDVVSQEISEDALTDVIGETSGEDTNTPPSEGKLCSPCDPNNDTCGENAACLPFNSGGDFCLTTCTTNNDCPSGYLCTQYSTDQVKYCVPGFYNTCAECLYKGCPEGQYCNQALNKCEPVKGVCNQCVKDDECGIGYRCYIFAPGLKKCVPECGENGECPENSTCKTMTDQMGTVDVKVCIPNGNDCCFGPDCQVCNCSGDKPYCDENGNCVECNEDAQCPATKPKCENHVCTVPGCPPEKPILYGNECVECTNDTHCAQNVDKPKCDVGTHTCVEVNTEDMCANVCQDPYPDCIVENGQVTCVQCTSNESCPEQCVCDLNQHICVLPDGSFCNSGGGGAGCTGDCTTNGCPNSPNFQLQCDPNTGCCYDKSGMCDNVTAFCIEPGSECKSIMDLFMGGGGGGGGLPPMPGLPGGGAIGMGFCTCTDIFSHPECMLGGGPNCVQCPNGMICLDPSQLLGALMGGGGTTPPANSDVSGVCVDLSGLLGGSGGGGGFPF